MFTTLKMKIAARRVERTKSRRGAMKKSRGNAKTAKRKTVIGRVKSAFLSAADWMLRAVRRIWEWICGINIIGLSNLALLIAIIVLFSMLIMDFSGCNKNAVVVISEPAVTTTLQNTHDAARTVRPRPATTSLPIRRDPNTRKMNTAPVKVVAEKKCPVAENQIARVRHTLFGDIVIDGRPMATVLKDETHIQGNLYLQNMRKYTLPCDIKIHGNLFLRDVAMLQFCGDFTVTGNIYVSPRSSFGPIPRTARLGGQVIL